MPNLLMKQKNLRDLAKIEQIKYNLPRLEVERAAKEEGVKISTEIWIYPNYEHVGYFGIFGELAENETTWVHILEYRHGERIAWLISPCLGVRPNGTLIWDPEMIDYMYVEALERRD